MTLYEQYCQARIDCGYDDGFQMKRSVWEACDLESQQSMVAQMQRGVREIAQVRAQHEAYRLRYGETW